MKADMPTKVGEREELDEAQIAQLVDRYNVETDSQSKREIVDQLKKITGLNGDLESLLEEDDFSSERVIDDAKEKKALIRRYQMLKGPVSGLETFSIADLDKLLVDADPEKGLGNVAAFKAAEEEDLLRHQASLGKPKGAPVKETVGVKPTVATEKNETLAAKLVGDLARLTASQVPAEREQAAEILAHLSPEQAAAIRPKLTPQLRQQFNDFEAEFSRPAPEKMSNNNLNQSGKESGFGRWPEKKEQAPYDPEIQEYRDYNRTHDKIVGDSQAKKTRRDFDPNAPRPLRALEKNAVKPPVAERNISPAKPVEQSGFGRRPEKREKAPYDPQVQEYRDYNKIHDQIVGGSERKKSRREYNPVDDIVKKIDALTEYDDPKSDREAVEIIRHMTPEQTAQLPGKMPPELIRRLMSIEVPPPAPVSAPEKAPVMPAAKPEKKTTPVVPEQPAEPTMEKPPVKPKKFAWQPEERRPRSRTEILAAEAAKKQRHTDELKKHLAKTGLGVVASFVGLKSFYDVPAYFRQRYAVRGNIFGQGQGKGLGGSIEELLAESQKGHEQGRAQRDEEGFKMNLTKNIDESPVIQAIRDLDKRLAMTREGSAKNSEQRNLIAKLLAENRHKETLKSEKRQQEIKIILDDYTTTKVTGVQAARDVLDTACMAMVIPTHGAAFKFRSLMYLPLSALDKGMELKKQARVEARTDLKKYEQKTGRRLDQEKKEKFVEQREKKMGLLKMAWQSMKETYENATRSGKGTGWQKTMKQVSAFGNILRLAGIAATSFITPGGYDRAVNQVIEALRHSETWSHAGKNFVEGALNRLSFGAAFHDLATGKNIPESAAAEHLDNQPAAGKTAAVLPSMTHSAGTAPRTATGDFDMTKNPSETNAAYNAENLAAASSENIAHTVWGGLKEQMLSRYGKDFSDLPHNSQDESIRLLVDRISADPEAYGLPKDLDYAKLSQEQIDQIPWDKVFSGEGEPAAAVHDLKQTLAEPGENLKNFGGGTKEWSNEESYNNAADFFERKTIVDKLADLSTKARRWHDASLPPTEKNRIIAEISEMRKTVERLTGGFLIYDDRNGDWNVQMPDHQTINVFHTNGQLAMNAPAIPENLPAGELANGPVTAEHLASGSKGGNDFGQAIREAEAKKIPTLDLANSQNIKGDFADAGIARQLAERPGAPTLDLKNVTSITPAALEAMCGKTDGYIILTGLEADKMDDAAYQALAHLKQSCTVAANDAVEKGFAAWQNSRGGKSLWEVDRNNVLTPRQPATALAENVPELPHQAAADFAAQIKENPYGIYHELNPDFADKYSPAQRESITAFFNSEIKERNELLNLLKEYQNKYGDRPEQLAAFHRLLENHISEQNNNLAANLKGLTDPNRDLSHDFAKVSGDALVMARANAAHEAEKIAAKSGLILPGEMAGNAGDELAGRVAAQGGPRVLTAADLHKIVGSQAEVGKEHVEVKGGGGNYEVFTSAEMRGTGEENLNMAVVNKLHLTPPQMEALKMESDRLSVLGAELEKHEPHSPEALAIIKVIKDTMEQGKKVFGTDEVFSQDVRQVAELE